MADEPTPSPRHDRDFVDRCLDDLSDHRGQWRRLGRLYAANSPSFERCCAVRDAVAWGRRLGMIIDGDRARGYCFRGHRHPPKLYMVKPGPPGKQQRP